MLPKHAPPLSKDEKMLLIKKVRNDQRIKIHGEISGIESERRISVDKSQGKHPEPPPRSQILVDADWTSSSAIFTVCRRIDLSMRGYPRSTRYATYHLRLYMHINRDNRGSLATAYRARGVGGGGGVHGDARRSPLRREFCSLHANGRHLLWEKRAPYEYVKWEPKQKKKKRYERSKDNGVGIRDGFAEKRK